MADAPRSPSDEAPLGLRERRRQATRRELADAALGLFERHGVHGTTADDIAEAAGVSPRTFFRYAATKENAVFLKDDGFEVFVARVRRATEAGMPVIKALEEMQLDLLEEFDNEHPDHHQRVLRTRRLIFAEPSLLALALALDAEHVDRLVGVVLEAKGSGSELEARTLVTALGTAQRLTLDEWARRAENSEHASARTLYAEIRTCLAGYFSAEQSD